MTTIDCHFAPGGTCPTPGYCEGIRSSRVFTDSPGVNTLVETLEYDEDDLAMAFPKTGDRYELDDEYCVLAVIAELGKVTFWGWNRDVRITALNKALQLRSESAKPDHQVA